MGKKEDLFFETKMMVFSNLITNCPVLSGNMKAGINLHSEKAHETIFVINAPSYDLEKWKKESVIIRKGDYNYANLVNLEGGFGRHNKSMYWANRALDKAARTAAAQFENVEVITNVKL